MTAGVSTLVASASIARTDPAPSRGRERGSAFEHLSIGQNLKLQVLRQLEQHRYEVAFGGRRHVVESRVPLDVGTQIEAQVEGLGKDKGDKLELRYLRARFQQPEAQVSAGNTAPDESTTNSAAGQGIPAWLQALAAQYRVPLDSQAQSIIARAAARAADPQLMTRGGLFLQKIAQRVNPQDLEALYRVLSGSAAKTPLVSAQAPFNLDDLSDNDDVAATLADALDGAAPAPGQVEVANVGDDANAGDGGDDDAQRALRLLNLQDEGSVAWRYGTLPLLVGGQLIELDLVMFRERDQHGTRGSLRRLVMTLDTTHFGRVQVEARAVDSRIIVKLSAASADAVEVLSSYGQDVRAAIAQLGWAVDEVCYEMAPQAGAAQEVVKHVLAAGTVDREL
ncbi:MAG TPA: hypothetical protein VGO61_22710 [Steroidobacteraceae bacterium]|jgi:hypothetical protein|nr:hypothetical protein [Steroidobacteraceae bacterium]